MAEPTPLDLLVARLADRVQDDEGILTTVQREAAIAEAVAAYSRVRPQRGLADLTGDGTQTYDLPAEWVAGFSVLQSVEFPAGESPPVYVDEADWLLYQPDSDTTVLRLLADTPSASQTIRLRYTALHVVDDAASTLPAQDADAVVNYAASVACLWLAAHYAQQGQATLSADVTNHESRVRQYRDLARDYKTAYAAHLGLSTTDGAAPVSAASTVLDWDSRSSWGGDRLTHRARWY